MSLIEEILKWAQNDLKPWQSDAARRLFRRSVLSADDFKDLYALLKAEHGIPDTENRQSRPIGPTDVPDTATDTFSVVLLGMHDLEHVNSIAEGQSLPFSPTGLTVVYGPNASGKSGYSRVLKRACRARDEEEEVLPNATLDKAAQGVPQAVFDVEQDGQQRSLNWKSTDPAPDLLNAISVFDDKCARAFLDEEQDVAFIPYGLDVVENLAQKVLPKLAELLEMELSLTRVDFSVFEDLSGTTRVGQAIAELPKGANAGLITTLGTVTEAETKRLSEIEKILTETDPEAKAKSLELAALRVSGLVDKIFSALRIVDDNAVEAMKTLDEETEAALRAQDLAAAEFRAGEDLLPGTGEQAWRVLFDAARKFSMTVAYPDVDFPVTTEDARCLLCQQPLSAATRARISRFNDFVSKDVAKLAKNKIAERQKKQQELAQISVSIGLDDALSEELAQHGADHLTSVKSLEQRITHRLTWLREALEKHAWDSMPALNADIVTVLQHLSTELSTESSTLREAADSEGRKAMESERAELSARVQLSRRLKQVLEAINKHQIHQKLLACKEDLKTRPISNKSKELTHQAVTEALRTSLNRELAQLGVGHLKMVLKERTIAGKTKHKLVLNLPVVTDINQILSEGEQRAVAIAAFLAELALAGHAGGIVFDDPVCSLDHFRRQKVARRLVEEATRRQVIVFTHDTVFLGELRDALEQTTIPHAIHHLEWENQRPGVVRNGLPWEHKSWKERIDAMEKLQRSLSKSWPAYPSAEDRAQMRTAYSELRATLERVIQDHVFAGVVARYRDWVRVDKLGDVVGFTSDDYQELSRLHKKCCMVTEAHDPASAKDSPTGDPSDLAKDISDLKAVTERIRDRRKKTP